MEFTHIPDYLDIDLKVHRRGGGEGGVYNLNQIFINNTLFIIYIPTSFLRPVNILEAS